MDQTVIIIIPLLQFIVKKNEMYVICYAQAKKITSKILAINHNFSAEFILMRKNEQMKTLRGGSLLVLVLVLVQMLVLLGVLVLNPSLFTTVR